METNTTVARSMGAPVRAREVAENSPSYPSGVPNAETIAAMQEFENDDLPTYATVDDLFKALHSAAE